MKMVRKSAHREAADIACGLLFFWIIRGHAAEGRRWYERILNLPSAATATTIAYRIIAPTR
jgi:hypothetical protein